jgi:hypothetical protein
MSTGYDPRLTGFWGMMPDMMNRQMYQPNIPMRGQMQRLQDMILGRQALPGAPATGQAPTPTPSADEWQPFAPAVRVAGETPGYDVRAMLQGLSPVEQMRKARQIRGHVQGLPQQGATSNVSPQLKRTLAMRQLASPQRRQNWQAYPGYY